VIEIGSNLKEAVEAVAASAVLVTLLWAMAR